MTKEQERHLQSIKAEFAALVDEKYRKGQKEHGGDLFKYNQPTLLDNAIDEAIDLVTYLLTARSNIVNNAPKRPSNQYQLPGIVED